ncbi:MAG: hypothetical protein VXY77_00035 [Pseudomonadota bacterium]|nr:hypothetical protein [Pseudomonadota bacterium]
MTGILGQRTRIIIAPTNMSIWQKIVEWFKRILEAVNNKIANLRQKKAKRTKSPQPKST